MIELLQFLVSLDPGLFGPEMLAPIWMLKGTKSSTSTDKSTKVSTTTTTSIGDIGLTGKDAIEMAAVLSRGVELTTRAVGDIIVPVTNAFAQSSKAREETARAGLEPRIIQAEAGKSPAQLFSENLPLIALGIGAIVVFKGFVK